MSCAVITGVGVAAVGFRTIVEVFGPNMPAEGGLALDELQGPQYRRRDQSTRLALKAANDAFREAGIFPGGENLGSRGTATIVSTNFANMHAMVEINKQTIDGQRDKLDLTQLPITSTNACAGWLSIAFGLTAGCHTVSSGAGSGVVSLELADRLIRLGRADAVLVVGVEPHDATVAAFLRDLGITPWTPCASAIILMSESIATNRSLRSGDANWTRIVNSSSVRPDAEVGRPPLWMSELSGAAGILQAALAHKKCLTNSEAVQVVTRSSASRELQIVLSPAKVTKGML